MAAPISSAVISIRSGSRGTPWPPVTNILMIRAPSLISWRTALRNSSGPSHRCRAPGSLTLQYHGA